MDDVFNEAFSQEEEGKGDSQQPAQQPQQQPAEGQPPAGEQQPQQQPGEQGAAPPAAGEQGTHVPLAALEAERKGRQDWKEKATRYEEQLKARDEELARLRGQSQQPQQPQQLDPVQYFENRILNMSERAARRTYGSEEVDKANQRVMAEFRRNPALHAQIVTSADPWDELVQVGRRLLAMDEIGSDPTAYRAKLEAEIRASLTQPPAPPAAGQQPAAQQPAIPQSLAGARSAGGRDLTFTGPTPMENLFEN